MRRIAEKEMQSTNGLVELVNNLPSEHTSEINRPGPANSTRPASTTTPDGPVSAHTTGPRQLPVSEGESNIRV